MNAARRTTSLAALELAGGPDAPLVMVPTAGGGESYDSTFNGLQPWRDAGARNLTVLHTNDPRVADTDAFIQPLNTAAGVFFFGGRQWRLVDAYGGTKTEAAFRAVLDRGGVIGGSSAGATIQGSYLVRGDTAGNTLMMGSHQRGFAYLKNVGIDQHVLRRGSTVGEGGRFYLLAPGDRFNLATREAVRPGRTPQPVEGVRRVPWDRR